MLGSALRTSYASICANWHCFIASLPPRTVVWRAAARPESATAARMGAGHPFRNSCSSGQVGRVVEPDMLSPSGTLARCSRHCMARWLSPPRSTSPLLQRDQTGVGSKHVGGKWAGKEQGRDKESNNKRKNAGTSGGRQSACVGRGQGAVLRGRTCCVAPFSAVASAAHPAGTWAPPSAACPPFPSHAVGQHLAAAVTHAGGTCCRCSSARTTCYWAPGGRWCCGRARCLRTPSTAAAAGWRRHSTCSWCCTVGMCLPA